MAILPLTVSMLLDVWYLLHKHRETDDDDSYSLGLVPFPFSCFFPWREDSIVVLWEKKLI